MKRQVIEFSNRRFGVEFEVIVRPGSDWNTLARTIRAAGVAVEIVGYYQNNREGDFRRGWKIKRDGSLRPDRRGGIGAEIVSPPLRGLAGLAEVEKVLAAVNHQTYINQTCGFHVHHETRDFSTRAFAKLHDLYYYSQNVINGMLPPSRRNGFFCAPVRKSAAELKAERGWTGSIASLLFRLHQGGDGHHTALNFGSFALRGTVEFRQAAGTTEGRKATSWIVLTQRMVEKAASGRTKNNKKAYATAFHFLRGIEMASATIRERGETVKRAPADIVAEAAAYMADRFEHFRSAAA
jgi:hypothetical protein